MSVRVTDSTLTLRRRKMSNANNMFVMSIRALKDMIKQADFSILQITAQ